jgi:two-component system, LytTR family, response regulator
MYTCMIVDDEQHALDLMKQHVDQTSFLRLAHATTSPVEAIQKIRKQKIDFVFIDVQMPELSGLDVIKACFGKTIFVLCTAYPDYALEGYEYDVADYLLKPVTYPRFMKSVTKVINLLSDHKEDTATPNTDFMFIKTEVKGKMVRVNFNEIDYIESLKNYVAFVCGDKKNMALFSMKFLEEALPPDQFIRVHNSYIVPLRNIMQIEGNELSLKNTPDKIPVGVTFKEKLMEVLKIK